MRLSSGRGLPIRIVLWGISLRFFCLTIAPIMGFLAGSIVAQGPSHESDALSSAVVGGGTPAALSFLAARLLGRPAACAVKWAAASIAATGVFWVVFVLLFFLSFKPV